MLFRRATLNDLPAIIAMLANDKLGTTRELNTDPLPSSYHEAFENIDSDPNQLLVVADKNAAVVGTLQLTFIQGLTYQGGLRAQIEAVRVAEGFRGEKIGERMILWAIEQAKTRGAHLVQLTSDKQRPDAIRFYERLGFKASHEGMKLHIFK